MSQIFKDILVLTFTTYIMIKKPEFSWFLMMTRFLDERDKTLKKK
jgi:hypothetical protein